VPDVELVELLIAEAHRQIGASPSGCVSGADVVRGIGRDPGDEAMLFAFQEIRRRGTLRLEAWQLGGLPTFVRLPDEKPIASSMGDNNTVIGIPPAQMGSGNTIVNFADEHGNTILNRPMIVGYDAHGGPGDVVVGAGAGGRGLELAGLLRQLATALQAEGATEAAAMSTALAVSVESPTPDRNAIRRMWDVAKVGATTSGLVSLAARIEPLIHSLLH
jgi:hypothetical protein